MDVLTLISAVPAWLVVVISAFVTCYLFFTWDRGYFKKQGVKTVKPWSWFSCIFFYRWKKPLMEDDKENYTKFGRVYGCYEGGKPILHIGDPDLIRQVTVKDFSTFPYCRDQNMRGDAIGSKFLTSLRGDQWKMMRNIITPSFTTGKLRMMSQLIEDCCKTLVKNLNKFAESGEPFQIKTAMSAYTMDVIALCAFGTKLDSMANPDNLFLQHAQKLFSVNMSLKLLIFVYFPKLAKLLKIKTVFSEESMLFFKDVVDRVIEMRKVEKESPRDFLALLLEAKIDENEELKNDESENSKESVKTKKVLTSDLITAQSVLFLLAGHETTATLLTFTLYLLARNPHVQNKLAEEIEAVTSKHQGKINYEIVTEMPYLAMVISEALRVYPPGVRAERTCVEEGYELGGITLQKGMVVRIPIYAIHHDPEFYPYPEKFDPERFAPENKANRNSFTYLPFGAGPRNCIGSRFAVTEARMTLAYIIKNFRIKTCPQTEDPLEYFTGVGLLQPKSLTLAIERRTKN